MIQFGELRLVGSGPVCIVRTLEWETPINETVSDASRLSVPEWYLSVSSDMSRTSSPNHLYCGRLALPFCNTVPVLRSENEKTT